MDFAAASLAAPQAASSSLSRYSRTERRAVASSCQSQLIVLAADAAFQAQPTKPAVCQVEVNLLTEALGANAEAVAHYQDADYWFRIDRGPSDRAVEWC